MPLYAHRAVAAAVAEKDEAAGVAVAAAAREEKVEEAEDDGRAKSITAAHRPQPQIESISAGLSARHANKPPRCRAPPPGRHRRSRARAPTPSSAPAADSSVAALIGGEVVTPMVVFVNSKSGGRHGPELKVRLHELISKEQVMTCTLQVAR
ncbi:diacylglycerol kinase 3-like [Hordeum vulgare]|nr:diacylglycerol kinase 3-like [Hordeum vulgare]